MDFPHTWAMREAHVEEVLEQIARSTRSQRVVLHSLAIFEGVVFIDGAWGEHILEVHELAPIWDTREEVMVTREHRWAACAPAPHHLNKLTRLDRDFKSSPFELFDAHALLHDGERFLGHLMLEGDITSISPSELLAMKNALAQRWAHHPGARSAGHIMTTRTGRKESWCDGARTLLGEEGWEALAELLRDHLDEASATPLVVGAFGVTSHPMDQGQRDGQLLTLTRPSPILLDPLATLTPMQREICAHYQQTNAEIAEIVDLSVDGVKYHLKKIYQQLSVSTRAELAALLARLSS